MLDGPHDRVQHQFELDGGDLEQRREAVVVHGLEQEEEVGSVLRELLKVLVDHLQGALEDGIKDLGDLRCDASLVT